MWNFDYAKEQHNASTQVLDWLFIANENDIDEPLYGKVLTPNDFSTCSFHCKPMVDFWLDLNPTSFYDESRRRLIIPNQVQFIHFPLQEDSSILEKKLILAKIMLDDIKINNNKALISCKPEFPYATLLALWFKTEESGFNTNSLLLSKLYNNTTMLPFFTEFIEKYIKGCVNYEI